VPFVWQAILLASRRLPRATLIGFCHAEIAEVQTRATDRRIEVVSAALKLNGPPLSHVLIECKNYEWWFRSPPAARALASGCLMHHQKLLELVRNESELLAEITSPVL
jgi:hypothetical protein